MMSNETTFAGSPMSAATLAAYARLETAGKSGKSERTLDGLRVSYHLNCLRDDGLLRNVVQKVNGRWMVDGNGFRGVRYYTTTEAEAFIHGADAARGL